MYSLFSYNIQKLFFLLILICLLLSCGEEELSTETDCDRGINFYSTDVEDNMVEVNSAGCGNDLEFSSTNLLGVFNPVFSPLEETQIVFARSINPLESNNPIELVHFDLCSGIETILDTGIFIISYKISWTEQDWIYYQKQDNFYRIKSNGENLQIIPVPNAMNIPQWNDNGDKVLYTKQLLASSRIIIADQSFVAIDSIDAHRFSGPYEWLSEDEFYYTFSNEDFQQDGIYKYKISTGASELIVPIEDDNIAFIEAIQGNDEVFWMTNNSIFKTNASSGLTEEITSISYSRNYDYSVSKSTTSDYLLAVRNDILSFDACKGESAIYLTMINVETGEIRNLELN